MVFFQEIDRTPRWAGMCKEDVDYGQDRQKGYEIHEKENPEFLPPSQRVYVQNLRCTFFFRSRM
jgi:hypothetical protein